MKSSAQPQRDYFLRCPRPLPLAKHFMTRLGIARCQFVIGLSITALAIGCQQDYKAEPKDEPAPQDRGAVYDAISPAPSTPVESARAQTQSKSPAAFAPPGAIVGTVRSR